MKKKVLLGVIVFIIALLLKTPASIVSRQIESRSAATLQGVEGSIWKGKAAHVVVDGVALGQVAWTLKPWHMLTGAAKGTFVITGGELNAKGDYALSMGNKVLTINNTPFDVTADFINNLQKYGRLNGKFRGTIDYMQMQVTQPQQAPPRIAATINWEKGGLTSPLQLPAGNYQLKIEPESDGKLIGKIQSKNAPVDIKGNIKLDKNWKYLTDLKIKTTPSGASLQGMLSMVGRPQPDGFIYVKENGKLFK